MLELEGKLLFAVLIIAAVSWLVIWLLTKLFGRIGGVAGAALVGSLIAYSWWNLASDCALPPQYIPPEPGSGSEGKMNFACDAPFGTFAYFMIDFGFPLCLELWALGCLLILARARTSSIVFARRIHR